MLFKNKKEQVEVKKKNSFIGYVYATAGCFLTAFAFNVFFSPNNLVTGGVSGISIIMNNVFGIPNSTFIAYGADVVKSTLKDNSKKLNDWYKKFDIKNNNLSQIEPYDLVGILGNLLDNAIEATEKSKDKTVRIESDFRNNFSVIIVSNSCVNTPKLDNSKLPSTTKNNKRFKQ